MRENCTYGSEGGEDESPFLPLSAKIARKARSVFRDCECTQSSWSVTHNNVSYLQFTSTLA